MTGSVADVRPWLAQATVVVVPLRSGGGTRLKILEALAMSRPVVSTTLGAEGLDLEAGREIQIADDPGVFARRVVELLADPAARQRLGTAGRRRVEQSYDWSVAGRQLLGAYEVAVTPRTRRTAHAVGAE